MKYLVLFCLFFFAGLQVPQVVENYTIGASAVVAELQADYEKMEAMAKEHHLSLDAFLAEAQKTENIFAKGIVQLAVEKVPRYLALKAQLEEIKTGNILTMTKIVFFQHDPLIWENVKSTFKMGLYLNLDAAWYVFISMLSIFLTAFIKALFFIFLRKKRELAL